MTRLSLKEFGKCKPALPQPNLNELQLTSYRWFLGAGLKEIFEEISPIRDHTGKELELSFEGYSFDEPRYDERAARFKEATYEAALRVKLKLTNKKNGKTHTQEIYFGDFPVMTDRGTFIINGVERVIVSQLIRSAGVYFTMVPWRGKKLFGAKIIPGRGAWLEFETDPDGALGVKIDRYRKVPATDLLRVFLHHGARPVQARDSRAPQAGGGPTDDQEIKLSFKEAERGKSAHIEATLKRDAVHDLAGSYLEIYRRLRPGDPATPQAAQNLVDTMFTRLDRYDLSAVGRFKVNQRLELDRKKGSRLLDYDDLVAVVREIIRLNNDARAEPDDIDHLGNRRLKAVGELLQGRLRIGFARMRRIVQDRMSTLDRETLVPSQLVNSRPVLAVLKEFFASSQLSQFMDQVNPLAELEHKRRLSALGPGGLTRERAGFEVRDVHSSHYGRICPIQTPEGANIGLINYLASYTRVNDLGFLETPYAKVKEGRVTNEIVWLDASEEEKYKIAHAGSARDAHGRLTEATVEARVQGAPGRVRAGEVDFIDIAPSQFVSVSTSLIPFLQHDDANRALMGSNMQRQAVVPLIPHAPYVGTGVEEKVAEDSGYLIRAEGAGEVVACDATTIAVRYEKGVKTYELTKFKRSNQFTCISQRPLVAAGEKVKKGDVLADGPATEGGVLALGQNLLVAFLSWEGANFEDAVILSDRVRREDLFTSIHIESFDCDVRDTKLGPEITTPDIPNASEESLRNLDEEGIIRIGAEVRPGDILVGKISPKGETELTPEERLLRAIFGEKAADVKDASLTLPYGKRGRVVGVKIFSRDKGDKLEPGIIKRIQVEVAQTRKVQEGDKLAGRHGNKGVISQIRPVEDMPYLEDGTPVDIILNPLGVASRMNLGQILETHLGWAAARLGYRAITPGLDSADEEEIRAELKAAGLSEDGKVKLYDGRSGKPFDRPVAVGEIYMMKLNHLVEDKVHMRSIGPYSLITQQPLGGKAQLGGQRFGEMEVWALEAYGARHTLQEMLTIKSDDVLGRSAAYEALIRGETLRGTNIPASFNVLVSELKALGFNVEPVYDPKSPRREEMLGIKLGIASPEQILSWSHGEVIKPETINYRTQRPEKDGLFSERIFGPTKDYECYCGKYKRIKYKGTICDKCGVEVTRSVVRRERLGHIALAAPVCHIWFLKSVPSRLALLLDVPSQKLDRVIYYVDYIVTEVHEENRSRALADLQRDLASLLKEKGEAKAKDKKKSSPELATFAQELQQFLEHVRRGTVLTEAQYFKYSRRYGDVFRAATGAEAVRSILEKLEVRHEILKLEKELALEKNPLGNVKALRRLKILKSMQKNAHRPEWMIMNILPVLPPDLRPMVPLDGGRYATSDLNDLYRRVINRNNRLKKLLEIRAPDVIVRNEKRMLQEAVDALIDNSARFGTQQLSSQRRPLRSLADMLRGKQGRFRQNLLGKRVDYSGRSVIVVGPQLSIGECGLPKRMALELFRPFVIGEILRRGLSSNIRNANRLINQMTDEVWAILEEAIKDRRVLLNRAPTLHRLSVQAFKPLLVEGLAIQVPPAVCVAFNADFDGDQMAVHVPLSEHAQREAHSLMAAERNLLKPATGDLIVAPTQDVVLGIYYLTSVKKGVAVRDVPFGEKHEVFSALESGLVGLRDPIRFALPKEGVVETTAGRIILNEALGGAVPFVNETLHKKKLNAVIRAVAHEVGFEALVGVLDAIRLVGFEHATRSGITWAIADLLVPKEKEAAVAAADAEVSGIHAQYVGGLLTEDERRERVIGVWTDVRNRIAGMVASMPEAENSIYQIIDSGARGSWAQASQMMGMKGLVANPKGETIELPITASYKEGLSVLEYFISTHGARKGTTDTALKTAQAGYLTRRLVDVVQDVIIREEDCGTKEGIEVLREDSKEVGQSFADRIFSRTLRDEVKAGRSTIPAGTMLTHALAERIEASKVKSVTIRSPMTCKTLYGICAACYGLDLANLKPVAIGEAVGIIAAQSIGEPGTQLTMRTFHTGGVAGVDITHGLPRVEELFEVRSPKGKAALAAADGVVEAVEERGPTKVLTLRPLRKEEQEALSSGKRVKKAITRVKNAGVKKEKREEYVVPRSAVLYAKVGDVVRVGEQLFEGPLDVKELLLRRGAREVERYLINEVQKIYSAEGASINNKYIELIVRQMFGRVRVKDPGDAPDLVMGEVVEKSRFLEISRRLRREGRRLPRAEQLLMGVTRVALTAESFLSAASFQDTARVLVKASIEGRFDSLRGLKENVIIGRLIPAGSGMFAAPEEEAPDAAARAEVASAVDGE
jgi:DNA-directed RNA polymerase beta' subunit